ARRFGIDERALAECDLAVGIADVVAEHPPDQQIGRRAVAALCNRFHVRLLRERPLPPVRTAWISARMASAISGAERAPRSTPTGPCTRASASALTPSSARWRKIVAPRREEPSIPT